MRDNKLKITSELYGEDYSDILYEYLESIDPDLNREIQNIAYDHYWAKKGLSIRDKSLITISSLIALGKEAFL